MAKYFTSLYVICLFLAGSVMAQESVSQQHLIKVGTSGSLPAYSYIDGRHVGLTTELYRELIELVEPTADIEFVIAPPPRLWQEIVAGKIDLNLTLSKDLPSNAVIIYQANVDFVELWSLKPKPIDPNEDLTKIKIATHWSHVNNPIISKIDPTVVSNYTLLMNMLIGGRVDAVMATKYTFLYTALQQELDLDLFHHQSFQSATLTLFTYQGSRVANNLEPWQRVAKQVMSEESHEPRWQRFLQSIKKIE